MTGYHANDRARCTRFIRDSDYLIIDADDTDFLGSGMYFWEHKSRAEWWLTEKHKEAVVSAELDLSCMLDLTDDIKLGFIGQIASKFDSAMRGKGIKQGQIGLKLDYLFERNSFLDSTYTSVRGHFYYKNRNEPNFLNGSRLTGRCVDIYIVRKDPSLVTQRQWVKT